MTGWRVWRADCHFDPIQNATIQIDRSLSVSRGQGWRRLGAATCGRRTRFSRASSRCVPSSDLSVRGTIPIHLIMLPNLPTASGKRQYNHVRPTSSRDAWRSTEVSGKIHLSAIFLSIPTHCVALGPSSHLLTRFLQYLDRNLA